MEWIFAATAIGTAVVYAVALGRGIEQRKRWAIEIARALGTFEGTYSERFLQAIPDRPDPQPKTDESPSANRLAA
jgi:hypothetical protein